MGLGRRGFISFLAGSTAGILCTPVIWKTIDDISIWSQNWPWIPRLKYGAKGEVASLCKLGGDVYGISVATVGGKPVSARGNKEHILSQGAIEPLGAASVQMLYSPARVQNPLKRVNGKLEAVSWEEAEQILIEKLQLADDHITLISGDETGSATEVLAAFVSSFGSKNIFFMPGEWQAANVIWNESLGGKGQLGYDLENSDCVVSFGADLFSSWGTTLRNTRLLVGRDKKITFAYVGPVQNNTASLSDLWIPCLPRGLGRLALGVCWHLFQDNFQLATQADGFKKFRDFVLAQFHPEQVAKDTGASVDLIARLAKMLVTAKYPLVIPGSGSGMGLSSFDFAAIMSLNILLGRINAKGGIQCLPEIGNVFKKIPSRADIRKKSLFSFLKDKKVKEGVGKGVVFVYEANPAYALPQSNWAVEKLLNNNFLVSFSTFLDETAVLADLVLPNSYFLERLDDAYTPYGSGKANYSVAKPVIEPLFDTRSTPDFILTLAKKMHIDLGYSNYAEVVRARSVGIGAVWDKLVAGQAWEDSQIIANGNLRLWQDCFQNFKALAPLEPKELLLTVSWLPLLGNFRTAFTPYALPGISATDLQGNDSFVYINSLTAEEFGLREGQYVLMSGYSEKEVPCKMRVHISEEVMPGVVWALLGFGHTAWDAFTKNKGENVFRLYGCEHEACLNFDTLWSTGVHLEKMM